MKPVRTLDVTTLEMGPKMIYQCNCACPKGTQAHISTEPSACSIQKNKESSISSIAVQFEVSTG